MKRGAEQLISPKGKKIKTEQIQYVPNEIWQVIFAHLPPSFLGVVRQVSTEWRTLVQNLSEQSLHRYFPYLINHPDCRMKPLSLFIKEYQRYHTYFSTIIPMDAILSVLQGNTESILSEANSRSQKIFYGLHFALGYLLPKKGLSEENILEIKGWAMVFASWQGNIQLLGELLILQKMDWLYKKNVALQCAAQSGHVQVIEKLVAHGANVNNAHDGVTPIYMAAQEGHVEAIVQLAALGANINIPNNNGATPVYIAAQNGHVEAIVRLVELGANVNTPNNNGATPIYIAAQNGYVEVIVKLAEYGADVNIAMNDGTTPVSIAAQNGHIGVIVKLIALGANVNMADNDGATPVFFAAQEGHVEVIAKLVESGADVNTPANNGATPILVAAERGHVDVVVKLAKLGVDVNTPNNYDDGATPIFIAAQEGHAKVVQFLLRQNVNIQPYISSAESLFNFAQSRGSVAIIDRMNQLIEKKIQEGNDIEKIALLPSEIAYIMGYDEIVNMFKTFNDANHNEVVTIIESHFYSQSSPITFVFNFKKDSSSSSSGEEKTIEIDENNQEQTFLSRDYCRQM